MRQLWKYCSGVIISFKHDTKGATALEYGLFVALISVIIMAGLAAFSTSLIDMFGTVDSTVSSATGD